jgi:hypothetical protein
MERLIDPIVADLQAEHAEALRGRRWRVAWTCARGYAVFWKVVALHTLRSVPRALWNGMTADGWGLGRTMAYSLVAFIALTLLQTVPPMIAFYSRIPNTLATLLLVPQAIPLSIPIALPLAIVFGMWTTRVSPRRIGGVVILAILATLLSFAAMLIIPDANQAWRVVVAKELGHRGVTEYSLPRGMNELSLAELASRSQDYEARGLPETARKFKRTYHLRMALPVATAVLSLLAVGVAGAIRARAWRVAAMVIAFGLYWATLALGEFNTGLAPVVAVWAPNVVFTAIALLFLRVSSGREHTPSVESGNA